MRRLIEAKIDALPDPYCVVFVLRAVQELSVEELSKHLGIPKATVRGRYSRARSLLRKSLSKELDVALGNVFPFAGALRSHGGFGKRAHRFGTTGM